MNNILDSIEKRYFHELDVREKIFTRLQFNFVFYTTFLSITAYMTRMVDYTSSCIIVTLFFVGIILGILILVGSIYFTYRVFTGLEYRLAPSAEKILEYRSELEKNFKDITEYNKKYSLNIEAPDPKIGIILYMERILSKCVSFNQRVNEGRRIGVKNALWLLMLATLPIIFSVLLFVVFDLDASSPRKNILVQDINLSKEVKDLNKNILLVRTSELNSKIHTKETMIMTEEKNEHEKKPVPPPPSPPKEPEWEISNESAGEKMPSNAEILKE